MTNKRMEELHKKVYLTLEDCQEIMDHNNGNLMISSFSLRELPDDLTVPGDVHADSSNLIKFPKKLNIGGTLHARNTFITSIPSDMRVGENIYLCGSCLRYIPDNFVVNGTLNISGTPISELPRGLTVRHDLDAYRTYIRHLPDDINVGRSIRLYNTPLEDFPANMTVEGSLHLDSTCITKLPDGLTVNADLSIAFNPQLTELPSDMSVRFGINATMCGIKSIPPNIRDAGGLVLQFSPITTLPDDMSFNGGDLDIRHTNITNLPKGICVHNTLKATNSELTSLPDDIIVGDDMYIDGTNVSELPENLIVPYDLDISNTNISKLPENIIVGGILFISPNQLKSIPAGVKISRITTLDRDYVNTGMSISRVNCFIKPSYNFTDGEYVEGKYLYADDILTQVKSKKTCGKYTIYYGVIDDRNVVYDGTYYAHCDNIRDGIRDIEAKYEKDKKLDEYRELSTASVVSKDDAINMYRAITGACQQGTQMFIDSLGDTIKDEYTISEIIELTSGRYGSDTFRRFFVKED